MKLNQEIIEALEGNQWVERLTASQIIYTYKFKSEAVEEYSRGVSAEKIFRDAGIPVDLLRKNYARNCLKMWLKKYQTHGLGSLKKDTRGRATGPQKGRPRKKSKDKLTYEELEAIVKIQTEVIETLKKRRALAQRK